MDMGFSDSGAFDTVETGQSLRPLGWSELCARLIAAQDLRRAHGGWLAALPVGLVSGNPPGSFHRAAAQMLAQAWSEDRKIGEGFINPTCSTNRKDNQRTPDASREMPLNPRNTRQADENCHD